MSFFKELQRRNVFKVGTAYLAFGWVLTQVSSTVVPALHLPGSITSIVVWIGIIGFPLVVAFAWVYELTPEGLKRESEIDRNAPVTDVSGRRLNYLTIALLMIAIVLFALDRLIAPEQPVVPTTVTGAPEPLSPLPKSPERAEQSIAVLPFADMSEDKDQEYFADGMAEEILNVLARVDGLRVASRTSSFAFKLQPDASAPVIARELGVRHILEGSVRKAGDTVRITVQLVDTDSDQHLWSDTFDRPLTTNNLFAIQDEVAGAVVAALREKMGATVGDALPVPNRTADVDAYTLFLEARALFQARRDLATADTLLEEALTLDPGFADALAIRAAIREFGGFYGTDFGDSPEARARGRTFAEKALAVDESNSLALAVIGLYNLRDHMMGREAAPFTDIIANFDRALMFDPNNSNAWHWKALVLAYLGFNATAVALDQRCIELDPTLADCYMTLAAEFLTLGRRQEAESVVDNALNVGSVAPSPLAMVVLAELKRRDGFLFLAPNVPYLRGWQKFNVLYDAMRTPEGDHRALAAELKALLVKNHAGRGAYSLLNAIGDYSRPVIVVVVGWSETMGHYRQSPEFKQHMKASGAVDYWRDHGFPPQCHQVGDVDFECE